MMPALERPFLLHVGEVMIPFEFGDAGDPLRAQGQEREDAERSGDGRPDAGCLVADAAWGRRWRWHAVESNQLRVAGGRHDARQVLRVREEREDVLQREGDPLLELEMVRNATSPVRGATLGWSAHVAISAKHASPGR